MSATIGFGAPRSIQPDHTEAVSTLPPTLADAPPRSAARWAVLLVVGVTLAVFGRCVGHEFLEWDDQWMVTSHKILNPPTWASVAGVWAHPTLNLYTPLAYTLWSGVAAVARVTADDRGITLSPAAFHLVNVLLHAGSAAMVFAILWQLTRKPWATAIGAGLFALHPLQVEPVAWVAGMNNVLAGLFGLASIAAYVRCFLRPPLPGGERVGVRGETSHVDGAANSPASPVVDSGRRWYLLAVVLLTLALLSKPTAIVVPVMLIAIDALILRRPLKKVLIAVAPLFAITLPFVIVGRMAQPSTLVYTPPPVFRLYVAGDALGFYLQKLAWPWPLVVEYGRSPRWLMDVGAAGTTYLALAVTTALVATAVTRKRWFVAGGAAVFVAGVLPVLGLVPFEYQDYSTVADRYAYLAMLGPAIVAAIAVARFNSREVYGIAAGVVLILAGVSFVQAGVWRDSFTLATHTVAHTPNSVVGETLLGMAYHRAKDDNAAAEHFANALRINPREVHANYGLGGIMKDHGRLREAIDFYQAAYDEKADFPGMYADFAVCLVATRQPQRAYDVLADVLHAYPEDPRLHVAMGFVLIDLGKPDDAAAEFNGVLQKNPNDARAKLGLAEIAKSRSGQPR